MKSIARWLAALAVVVFAGCASVDRDSVYQVSTLHALLEGVYDGETPVAELLTRGDLGIGTFNALDGEMVYADGVVYQVTADGKVHVVPPHVKTPFACVTFFEADTSLALAEGTDYEGFKAQLDKQLPTLNLPYAIRMEGTFSHVKTRSVPAQTKPYPRLVEVTKHQPTFEFNDVEGVIVGFRLPEYMNGINVPGYHVHFLTADRKGGGHVLEFTVKAATVEVDTTPRLALVLPESGGFAAADLSSDKAGEVDAIEK